MNHTARLPQEKPYRCEVCGQFFKYLKSFHKHRANHSVSAVRCGLRGGRRCEGAVWTQGGGNKRQCHWKAVLDRLLEGKEVR